MIKIAVDGYSLGFKYNGIQRYLDSIITNINQPNQIIYLFIPSFFGLKTYYSKNIIVVQCGPSFAYKNLIWTQIILPYYLFKNKISKLWSPTHRVPILTLISTIENTITIHDVVSVIHPKTMKKYSCALDLFFLKIISIFKVRYISVSSKTKQDFCKIYKVSQTNVKVINLASSIHLVTPELFNLKIQGKYILSVGTFEPRKNYLNLIIAYSKISEDIRIKFKLIIAGSKGWGNINIESKISELKLNSYIDIYTNINDYQLAYLYKNAYLTIYPSFYEGCGLPIIESNCFGVPVAVANIEPMMSLCPSSTITFNPFNSESIANTLSLVINDHKLYSSLKKNTMKESSKYSWQKTANDIYRYLDN